MKKIVKIAENVLKVNDLILNNFCYFKKYLNHFNEFFTILLTFLPRIFTVKWKKKFVKFDKNLIELI